MREYGVWKVYKFCPEEFTGWVKIPTKWQKGSSIKLSIEVACFMADNRVSMERAMLLEQSRTLVLKVWSAHPLPEHPLGNLLEMQISSPTLNLLNQELEGWSQSGFNKPSRGFSCTIKHERSPIITLILQIRKLRQK